jgi:hypothetical protein
MKFFILLTVFIFAVLATNEDDGRGQCNLENFVIKGTIDDLFKATPIALKKSKGCAEYLAEMKEQGHLFMTIDSKHAAYQLMDSGTKRAGLVRQPNKWNKRQVCPGKNSRARPTHTANPWYGGIFVGTDAEPNGGTAGQHEEQPPPPPVYFVDSSTVNLILLDGRCTKLANLKTGLARLLRPGVNAANVANNRKRKAQFTGAEKERHGQDQRQSLKRMKARNTIKEFENLPDLTKPLTTMTEGAVMQALNNMKYCIWSTSQVSLEGGVVLLCEEKYFPLRKRQMSRDVFAPPMREPNNA